ncbi:hypothetical protein IMCC20628_04760 (plasmid) [Hoeflea sp. IMCC20628]|nr:hypothetical protein IMCC20628_04760 [Hoeflea sp. IMCC20628]
MITALAAWHMMCEPVEERVRPSLYISVGWRTDRPDDNGVLVSRICIAMQPLAGKCKTVAFVQPDMLIIKPKVQLARYDDTRFFTAMIVRIGTAFRPCRKDSAQRWRRLNRV